MSTELSPKEKFIRETVAFLTSPKAAYYRRGERVYVDTKPMSGEKLLNIESAEFRSFLLRDAKKTSNLMLRTADAELIIDHTRFYAAEVAKPLAQDARAVMQGDDLLINAGWDDKHLIRISAAGTWAEEVIGERIFEPMPVKMKMVHPKECDATHFPELLKEGITDFGEMHCLVSVTCATMLLPATFSHPFIVFTGDQARGKSTTMKLLVQLIDPYENGELMTIGEDMRDFISLAKTRHSIALDNVSKLPFDEDLLSKMYSGGIFAARKMTTNSEISEVEMPKVRALLNGIGTAFSRSDLMSRCIFIEHPILTTISENGVEQFESLTRVEEKWQAMLPELLGSLLRATGAGLRLFRNRGGFMNKKAGARFVEYCILGECIAEEMGFPKGLFTKQVSAATEEQQQGAIEADDCAQLVLAWLGGERGIEEDPYGTQEPMFSKEILSSHIISPTELFSEILALAKKRGYAVYSIRWLSSVKSFSTAVLRSKKNIENGGFTMNKLTGGNDNRKLEFIKNK